MVSEAFNMLAKPSLIEGFDRRDDPSVERALLALKQAAIGNVVGQRVLERVFQIGEEVHFVKEFRRVKPCQRLMQIGLGHVSGQLQQRERNVFANDRGGLEQTL